MADPVSRRGTRVRKPTAKLAAAAAAMQISASTGRCKRQLDHESDTIIVSAGKRTPKLKSNPSLSESTVNQAVIPVIALEPPIPAVLKATGLITNNAEQVSWTRNVLRPLENLSETNVLGKLLSKAATSASQAVPVPVSSPPSQKAPVSTAITPDILSDCLISPVFTATSIGRVASSIASTSEASEASASTILTGSVGDSPVITAELNDPVAAPPIASGSKVVSTNVLKASIDVPQVISNIISVSGSIDITPVVTTAAHNQIVSPIPSTSISNSTKALTHSVRFPAVSAATSAGPVATPITSGSGSIEDCSISAIDRVASAEENYIGPLNIRKRLNEEHPVEYQIPIDLLRSLLNESVIGPQPPPAVKAESVPAPSFKVPSGSGISTALVNSNITPAEKYPAEAEASVPEIASQIEHPISLDWLKTVVGGIVIRSKTFTASDSDSVDATAIQAPPNISTSPNAVDSTVGESDLQAENVDQSVAVTLASTPSSAVPPDPVHPQLVIGSSAQNSRETESDIDSENPEVTPGTSKHAFSCNHFSPEILRMLVSRTVIGPKILTNAETLELTETSKKLVADVVARYHLEKGRKSSFEVLDEYAEVIVKLFKKEKKETYCTYRKRCNPGGKLYTRINYLLQSERNREKEEDDHIEGHGQPETIAREVNQEALNAISWLQLNRSPWSSVLVQWEISFPERYRDLKKPNKFPLILNSYPHLGDEAGFQLLDIDFRRLGYGDPAAGERKWRTLIVDIRSYIAKHAKDPSAKELLQVLNNSDHGIDVHLCATLLGLNTVLIPVKAAKGFKPTVITAQNDTLWLCDDENAARSKLEAERDFRNNLEVPEVPRLIVFGTSIDTVSSTCWVTYKDIEYKLTSVSRGVDVLLKLILVFAIPVSKISKLVWIFIQKFVYGVDVDYTYVSVTKLTEYLTKKQTC